MFAKNEDRLFEMIQVRDHVEALRALIGQPGLVFQHSIHSFRLNGNRARVIVIINHALLYMPETQIYYLYEAEHYNDAWVITSVQMLDELN